MNLLVDNIMSEAEPRTHQTRGGATCIAGTELEIGSEAQRNEKLL
jgi:hypothetical protein